MFNYFIVISALLSSIVQIWLATISWRKRHQPGAIAFTVMFTTGSIWALIQVIVGVDIILGAYPQANFWEIVQVGVSSLWPASYLLFVLAYTYKRRFHRWYLALPALYLIPAFTLLHSTLAAFDLITITSVYETNWYALHLTYTYVCLIVGMGIVFIELVTPRRISIQAAIGMIALGGVPFVAELVQIGLTQFLTLPSILESYATDITPILLGVSALIGAHVVLKLNLFDLLPIAYERTVASMRDGVLVCDEQLTVQYCNDAAARYLRLPNAQSIASRPLSDSIIYVPEITDAVNEMTKGKAEVRLSTDEYEFLILKQPLRDLQGQRMGWMFILRDISDEVEAEAHRLELAVEREQTRFLREFISHMSHDYFNSLSIISSSLYLIERSKQADKRTVYLERSYEQIERLQGMLRDMLTVSELESGSVSPSGPQLINEVVLAVVQQYTPLARQKQLHFHYSLPQEDIQLRCDETLLTRAISGLVENAIHYTEQGGQVTLSTTHLPVSNALRIDVTDTGRGIPEADLPYIFQRFYRGESHRPLSGGSGLGLSITQKVIEAHGGTIHVQSAVGEGTTFSVVLPLTIAHVQDQPDRLVVAG